MASAGANRGRFVGLEPLDSARDVRRMLGERRDQTTGGDEGGRSKNAERKKMWIRLAVEHTEHQTFTDTLRVHGIIEEAPIDIGMHHTHVVGLRDDIKLSSSKGFSKPDRDLLDESLRAANQSQVACWWWRAMR